MKIILKIMKMKRIIIKIMNLIDFYYKKRKKYIEISLKINSIVEKNSKALSNMNE
jgi:hypothetical protein